MQLDAKFAELEARVQKITEKQREIEGKVNQIMLHWQDNPGVPGVPTRLDRIEQRSLSARDAKSLRHTELGTWLTLTAVVTGIAGLILERLLR